MFKWKDSERLTGGQTLVYAVQKIESGDTVSKSEHALAVSCLKEACHGLASNLCTNFDIPGRHLHTVYLQYIGVKDFYYSIFLLCSYFLNLFMCFI